MQKVDFDPEVKSARDRLTFSSDPWIQRGVEVQQLITGAVSRLPSPPEARNPELSFLRRFTGEIDPWETRFLQEANLRALGDQVAFTIGAQRNSAALESDCPSHIRDQVEIPVDRMQANLLKLAFEGSAPQTPRKAGTVIRNTSIGDGVNLRESYTYRRRGRRRTLNVDGEKRRVGAVAMVLENERHALVIDRLPIEK